MRSKRTRAASSSQTSWTSICSTATAATWKGTPARLFLARGLRFGEPETESTETLKPFKVKFEEAVRMVMDAEITQGISCTLILKAARLLQK